jgi:PPOX class probable F420-dependent enzyme
MTATSANTDPVPVRASGTDDEAGPAVPPTERMLDLITGQQVVMLATRQPDGAAHVVPVIYLFEHGRFLMATSAASRKVRNIAADPRVTVTVEDRQATAWVSATGTAALLRGPDSRNVNRRLDELWMTDVGFDAIGSLVAAAEDVTVVVTPHTWLAWDFESGFLAALDAGGVRLDDAGRWFR